MFENPYSKEEQEDFEKKQGKNIKNYLQLQTLVRKQSRDFDDHSQVNHIFQKCRFHLKYINLSSIKIGDKGLIHISKSGLDDLKSLDLWGSRITGYGLKHFLKKKWNNLERLDLGNNNIGDIGLKKFHQTNFPSLKVLLLRSNGGIYHPSDNRISFNGCLLLYKCDFPSLRLISFPQNAVNNKRKEHLQKMYAHQNMQIY